MTVVLTPALSISVALAVGMLAQVIAGHLALPGIILLLGAGVLLGPDVVGLVQPAALGPALPMLVGFSVAVILFEGGMNLKLRHLRREAVIIRRLVTIGAGITAVLGSTAAYFTLRWDLRTSALFGTLVIVTGPTVITPLLRRFRIAQPLSTILEAEGVLVDAVGALVAVVALEIAIAPSGAALASGVAGLGLRLLVGTIVGIGVGAVIVLLLRAEHLVPKRLENALALAFALAAFQISNALTSESGIVASIVAGIIVGNAGLRAHRTLLEFKEQITVLLLGMIFVLLAADVRIAEVRALGWPGVIVVALLMVVVRPVGVLACAVRTELSARERVFLAWMAPRGIVAAAIASLFAETLTAEGLPHATALRALVFLVIASTVIIQGLSGGLVASLLKLRRPADAGYVIVGAGPLALQLGAALRASHQAVQLIDSDPAFCRTAEEAGFRVILGSALQTRSLQRASLDTRRGLIALTGNDAVNLLCAAHAMEEFSLQRAYVAVDRRRASISPEDVDRACARVLFGAPRDLDQWSNRCARNGVVLDRWRAVARSPRDPREATDEAADGGDPRAMLLPLLVVGRNARPTIVDERWRPRRKDELIVLVDSARRTAARDWLTAGGWSLVPESEPTSSEAPI